MPNVEQELVYCGNCNGSGEGLYNGAVCYVCKGLGEIWVDVKEEVEEDEEDEEEDEDPDDYIGMGWVDDRGRP